MRPEQTSGSVKRQLIRVILTACSAVVAFTCGTLFVFEVRSYRAETLRSLSTVANIIAESSAGVLVFDDHKMAGEVLAGLRVEPEISVAALFDKQGRLYATFPRDADPALFPPRPTEDGPRLRLRDLTIEQPVVQGGMRVGTIYLRGNLVGTYQRLTIYGLVVLGVAVCSIGIALVLSRVLERRISAPLAALTATARGITEKKDFSVRLEKVGTEEFDGLTGALNSMLEEIQRNSVALKAGEARFRAMADNMAQLAWMTGGDGEVQWYNKRWVDYTGFTLEEMLKKPHGALLEPSYHGRVIEKFQAALKEGKDWEDVVPLRGKDGQFRWFLSRAFPIRDESGAVVSWFGTNTDITEQRADGEKIRAHADRAQILSQAATELFLADSPRDVLQVILPRVADLLGAEFHFNYVFDFDNGDLALASSGGLQGEQVKGFARLQLGEALCGTCARERRPVIVEALHECTDPTAQGVRALGARAYACYPLKVADRLLGTLSFASSSRERFEAAELDFIHTFCDLLAASLERARLAVELRTARDAAERASAAKDEFLAALSHELRTPLNPVLLIASDAAADERLPDPVRRDFETISKNVTVEARLIDDLLDLTRITRGKLEIHQQPLDVRGVLLDAISLIKPEVAEKRIELVLDLKATACALTGDAVRLQQVFWNVLKNAVKFTSPEGRITVSSKNIGEGTGMMIAISDTGIGLTAEELARVFEAFSQGDHAAEGGSHQFGGLGLGLAISRNLVELHGGKIYAESPGRNHGARFVIELPARVAPDGRRGSNSGLDGASRPARSLQILLVEDHEATRQALTLLLRRRGHGVVEADCVAAAQKAAAANRFDIVISDIGLPDESGYFLMADLRSRYGLKGIAMTGYGMEKDIADGVAAGFVAHLTKPVNVRSLDATLNAVTSEKS